MKAPLITEAVRPQTDEDFLYAAQVMTEIGGDFSRHIAFAYLAAEAPNAARLRAAFPDLFTSYFVWHTNKPKE